MLVGDPVVQSAYDCSAKDDDLGLTGSSPVDSVRFIYLDCSVLARVPGKRQTILVEADDTSRAIPGRSSALGQGRVWPRVVIFC